MCGFGCRLDCSQLLCGIQKAFVPSGNVIVDFDAKDVASLGVSDNVFRIVDAQAVCPDANVIGPVLFLRERARPCTDTCNVQQTDHRSEAISHHKLELKSNSELDMSRRVGRSGHHAKRTAVRAGIRSGETYRIGEVKEFPSHLQS